MLINLGNAIAVSILDTVLISVDINLGAWCALVPMSLRTVLKQVLLLLQLITLQDIVQIVKESRC